MLNLVKLAIPLLFMYNVIYVSKGDKMDKEESLKASRRGFIRTLSGMVSVAILASPKRLLAKKPQIKHIVNNLELEVLEKTRPQRDPSVITREHGGATRLLRESEGKVQPICTVNHTGQTIWEACNGENNPRAISRLVRQTYQVSSRQAHVDCLAFLVRLKRIGAVKF